MRADQLLVERGLAATRSQAQRLIASGVRWHGARGWQPVAKNGDELPREAEIELLDDAETRYVSRGGLKLEGALAASKVDVRGKALLVQTGWDVHWRTDQYFEGHPYLTREAAAYLVEAGAVLVGIDSLNIDDTADMTRPVHSTLLRAGIPIVEHMTGLARLPERGFQFFATPVKVKGMATFPVRAFGLVI